MKMRNSALEKVAVRKVKHEVDAIIEHARAKLSEYVEDESETSLLAEVQNSLVQVEKTLQLVQINGAAVLAREMCDVVDGLINESIKQKDKAQECLSRGILQISDYLEYVQAGNKDLPVVLLPLLNDLRGVREAPLLSEHILFFPDFDDIDVPHVKVDLGIPPQEYAKKIRYGFQTGLVSLIQNKDTDAATTKMCKVAIRLHQCSDTAPARRLWWVTSAVAQALAIGVLPTSTGLASLLGQVDRQIKRFIEVNETEFAESVPSGLIKNLLYYVGIAQDRGRIVSKVKQAYNLNELIPTDMDIDKMREGLAGPNADVLEAVSKALHEDIETLKDSIELYVHSKNRSPESVKEVSQSLQKIADTLSMLGLDEPREEVLREVNTLNGLSEDELEHADSNFISIAETLIKAENIVDNFVNYRILNKPAVNLVKSDDDGPISSDSANLLRKIQVQTIAEALSEIEEAKNIFSQVLTAPEDQEKFEIVQDHFRKVIGALSMLNLGDAVKILECIQAFLLDDNATQELSTNPDSLDVFADSITSVECYLEALVVDEGDPRDILEYGIKKASALIGEELVISDSSKPLQTVEVKELEEEESLALLSAADLELKKKSKISDENIDLNQDDLPESSDSENIDFPAELDSHLSKPGLDDEVDLEALSATSLDLSIDYDLFDANSKNNQNEVSEENELIELESTRIEETGTKLNSKVDQDLDSDINLGIEDVGEPASVVELDLEATNMFDLDEIEEELSTHSQAYDLSDLDEITTNEDSNDTEILLPEMMSGISAEETNGNKPYQITLLVDGTEQTLFANRGDADKEVIEVFIEEAEEEVEKINLNRKIWKLDKGNEDALTIMRRCFHTLKGGGRLVGAEIIGEYAWLIENILNKVIDKSFVPSASLHDLLEKSEALLNDLVLQLKSGREPLADVPNLYLEAQNFIENEKNKRTNDLQGKPNIRKCG